MPTHYSMCFLYTNTIIDEKSCGIELWKIIPNITTIINTIIKIGAHLFKNCIIFIFNIIRNTIKIKILKQIHKTLIKFNQTKLFYLFTILQFGYRYI